MIALVGLLGMLLGQQAVDMAKRHFVKSAQASIQHDVSGATARGSQISQDNLEERE